MRRPPTARSRSCSRRRAGSPRPSASCALAEALRDHVIAGAGLDVYEREPQVEPLLLAQENVVLLPHIASASERTRVRMAVRAAENILAFLDGKPLLDPVP